MRMDAPSTLQIMGNNAVDYLSKLRDNKDWIER